MHKYSSGCWQWRKITAASQRNRVSPKERITKTINSGNSSTLRKDTFVKERMFPESHSCARQKCERKSVIEALPLSVSERKETPTQSGEELRLKRGKTARIIFVSSVFKNNLNGCIYHPDACTGKTPEAIIRLISPNVLFLFCRNNRAVSDSFISF